ncbi:MAG: tagaturonate reductase, partial [Clostridiales bacterium]|nr:tagaturonate reductase [Clostridiales bacterium]
QFGEGNFLRAFADYFVDAANEKAGFDAKVAVVQPIAQGGLKGRFDAQDCLYTLYLRGFEGGAEVSRKRVVSSIGRFIDPYEDPGALWAAAANPSLRYVVSNTTEAGIAYDGSCAYGDMPPSGFPAKLARFLHERWKAFGGGGGGSGGLIILSCELIDDNGKELAACVRRHASDWGLEAGFTRWLEDECLFCSTLVDRIVTGYPGAEASRLNAENGYEDGLLDAGEAFGLWVIEGPEWLAGELPFARAGLPVKVVADHAPYKKQKVRILNGAHTSMAPVAWLCGLDIVRDCMRDEDVLAFFRRAVWREIIPALPLPRRESEAFAASVEERFRNPFIDHALLSIALNSTSKWRARVLPSLKEYAARNGSLPACLAFGLAAGIALCAGASMETAGGRAYVRRGGQAFELRDDAHALEFYAKNGGRDSADLARLALSNAELWGEDLAAVPGLEAFVAEKLGDIRGRGMRPALRALLKEAGQ